MKLRSVFLWIMHTILLSVQIYAFPPRSTSGNSNTQAASALRSLQVQPNHSDDKSHPSSELLRQTHTGDLEMYIPQLDSILKEFNNAGENAPFSKSLLARNIGLVTSAERSKSHVGLSNFNFQNPLIRFENSRNGDNFKQSNHSLKDRRNLEASNQTNPARNGTYVDSSRQQEYKSQDSKYTFGEVLENTNNQRLNTMKNNNGRNENVSSSSHFLNSNNIQKVPLVLITIHKEQNMPHHANFTSGYNLPDSININTNKGTVRNNLNYGESTSTEIKESNIHVQSDTHIHTGNMSQEIGKSQIENGKRFQYSTPDERTQESQYSVWKPMGLKSYKVSDENVDHKPDIYKYQVLNKTSRSIPHFLLTNNGNSHSSPNHSLLHVSDLIHEQNPSNTHSLLPNTYYNYIHKQQTPTDLPLMMIPLLYRSVNENLQQITPMNSPSHSRNMFSESDSEKESDRGANRSTLKVVENVIFPSTYGQYRNPIPSAMEYTNRSQTSGIIYGRKDDLSTVRSYKETHATYGHEKKLQTDEGSDRPSAFGGTILRHEVDPDGSSNTNLKYLTRQENFKQSNGDNQQIRTVHRQRYPLSDLKSHKNSQSHQAFSTAGSFTDGGNLRNNNHAFQSDDPSKYKKVSKTDFTTKNNAEENEGSFSSGGSRSFIMNHDFNNEGSQILSNTNVETYKDNPNFRNKDGPNNAVSYYDGYVIFPKHDTYGQDNVPLSMNNNNFSNNMEMLVNPFNNLETNRGSISTNLPNRHFNSASNIQVERNSKKEQDVWSNSQRTVLNVRTNNGDNKKSKVAHESSNHDHIFSGIYHPGDNHFQQVIPQKFVNSQATRSNPNSNVLLNYVLNVGENNSYLISVPQNAFHGKEELTPTGKEQDSSQMPYLNSASSSSKSNSASTAPAHQNIAQIADKYHYGNNNAPNTFFEASDQARNQNGEVYRNNYSTVMAGKANLNSASSSSEPNPASISPVYQNNAQITDQYQYGTNSAPNTFYEITDKARNKNGEFYRNNYSTVMAGIPNLNSASSSSVPNPASSAPVYQNNGQIADQYQYGGNSAPNTFYESTDQVKNQNGAVYGSNYSTVMAGTSNEQREENSQRHTNPEAMLLVLVASRNILLQSGNNNRDVANSEGSQESSSAEIVRFLSQESNSKKLFESFYTAANGNKANQDR